MKKNMMKVAAFLVAMTTVAGFASCSNDESINDEFIGAVSNNMTPSVVSVNRIDGTVQIPVNFDGNWTAEVKENEDELAWAGVKQSEGQGRGLLTVRYDYFNPNLQQQERNAEIIIRCGEQTQTVHLRQYIGLKDGEAAGNQDNEFYYDLWHNKGLGLGYNPETLNPISSIISINGIQRAATTNPKYGEMVAQTSHADALSKIALIDTLQNDSVRLKAGGHVDVKWSKFELGIDVTYDNKGLQLNNVKTYNTEQKIVFLESRLDPQFLTTALEDDPEFKGIAGELMSEGFKSAYKNIMKYHKAGNDKLLRKATQMMLKSYGPVIVTNAELGGSLGVSIRYDSLYMSNNYEITGKANGKLNLGMLEVKANADVTYLREGQDIWKNVQHFISCTGGSNTAITDLISLGRMEQPDPVAINAAVKAWAESICSLGNMTESNKFTIDGSNGSKQDNTDVVAFDYLPIWTIFPLEVAIDLEEIIMDYYKDKKIGINLSQFATE